jgi:hypothetical protein
VIQEKIVLATPTYDGWRHDGSMNGIRFATKRHSVFSLPIKSSLMDRGFNIAWCRALEERDAGRASYFAMIHADVEPEPHWLDKYVAIMHVRNVDVVSAIIPTKEPTGRTSTAIDDPNDVVGIERTLTLHECYRMPETFGAEICPGRNLLVNNGLMLVDLRKPWIDDLVWDTLNRIDTTMDEAGVTRRMVRCLSQDWYFSRQVQQHGGKVVATRAVPVIHHGDTPYANMAAWGDWEYDQEYAKEAYRLPEKEADSFEPIDLSTLSPSPAPGG